MLSYALPILGTVAVLWCASEAVGDAGPGSSLHSGFVGGIGAAVGIGVTSALARRRALQRTRAMLPAAFSATQRDLVFSAAWGGPLPDDQAVRAEARRLAEQRASARGSTLRVYALVFAVLAAALAVAGAVASPWWWGSGSLLALGAAWLGWQDRRLTQRLQVLRQTELPDDPVDDGIRRLVGDPVTPSAESGRGLVEIIVRKAFLGSFATEIRVRLNGQPVPAEWGHNTYLVREGLYRIAISAEYVSEYGQTTTTLDVPAGQRVGLHYSPPAVTFLPGRTGTEPQRSAGALGTSLVLAAFPVLAVVLLLTNA